jgi:hypothetical protein
VDSWPFDAQIAKIAERGDQILLRDIPRNATQENLPQRKQHMTHFLSPNCDAAQTLQEKADSFAFRGGKVPLQTALTGTDIAAFDGGGAATRAWRPMRDTSDERKLIMLALMAGDEAADGGRFGTNGDISSFPDRSKKSRPTG